MLPMASDPRTRGPAFLPEPVAFELLKLLVQVALADHELAPAEQETLLHVADALLPSDALLAEVEGWLSGDIALPAPDMGSLKEHRHEVMLEARRVVLADGKVVLDEDHMLTDLAALLGSG
jgi:uncharacterized tellurite resistance protein B-like protein